MADSKCQVCYGSGRVPAINEAGRPVTEPCECRRVEAKSCSTCDHEPGGPRCRIVRTGTQALCYGYGTRRVTRNTSDPEMAALWAEVDQGAAEYEKKTTDADRLAAIEAENARLRADAVLLRSIAEDAHAEIERLRELTRWRSVADEHPADRVVVLVVSQGRVCTADYDSDPFGGWSKPGVTHWMSLPQPPEVSRG